MDANRVSRILDIYTRLLDGETIEKGSEAKKFGVSVRSIQRDIESIHLFLEEFVSKDGSVHKLAYDRVSRSYYLKKVSGA